LICGNLAKSESDHLGMSRAIELLKCVRDVRDMDPQSQLGGALLEGSRHGLSWSQPSASESVDGLAEPDLLFAAQVLRCGCYVVVKPDSGTHTANASFRDAAR
jgi:hypothetical protein